jgi:hypothetical protein
VRRPLFNAWRSSRPRSFFAVSLVAPASQLTRIPRSSIPLLSRSFFTGAPLSAVFAKGGMGLTCCRDSAVGCDGDQRNEEPKSDPSPSPRRAGHPKNLNHLNRCATRRRFHCVDCSSLPQNNHLLGLGVHLFPPLSEPRLCHHLCGLGSGQK